MPNLMVMLGLNANSYAAGLNQAVSKAKVSGKQIQENLNKTFIAPGINSTIKNASGGPQKRYIDDFKALLDKQEKEELQSAVRAAARSNSARRLLRQRAAAQEQREAVSAQQRTDAAVEQASRDNLARRLRREREMKRQAAAQEAQANSFSGRASSFFSGMVGGIGSQIAAVAAPVAGIFAAKQFVSDAISVDMAYQRIKNTLGAVTGSTKAAAEEFEFLRAVAHKTGGQVTSLGEDYAGFAMGAKAMGMSIAETRKIFDSFATLGASMGLSGERQKMVMLAITQMMGKGTVSMQELKQQLGDHLPQSMDLFAKAAGVTRAQLIDLVGSGELSASILVKVADIIQQSAPKIDETTAAIGRQKNAWEELKAQFGAEIRPQTIGTNNDLAAITRFVKELKIAGLVVDQISARPFFQALFGKAKSDLGMGFKALETVSPSMAKKLQEMIGGPKMPETIKTEATVLKDFRVTEAQIKSKEKEAELEKQIADERAKGALIGLSEQEKRLKLIQAVKDAEAEIFDATAGEETVRAQLELLKAQNSLAQFNANIKQEEKERGRFGGSINELQRVGAYSAQNIDTSILNEARITNAKLDRLIRNTEPKRIATGGTRF